MTTIIGKPKENNLSDHGRLLIRRAVLRDDWISDAILDLAAGNKTEWTPQEWFDLLMDLESSDMTIKEFIREFRKSENPGKK